MIAWRRQTGGDQDRAEFVAVEVGDVGLVVDPRSADVHRRGVLDEAFLLGVAVEPDDRAQPAGDGGPGLAALFEVASEALDVDPADVEQTVVVFPAPGGELAQIEGVGVAGEATVAGQESEHRHPLDVAALVGTRDAVVGVWTWVGSSLQSWPETQPRTQQAPGRRGHDATVPSRALPTCRSGRVAASWTSSFGIGVRYRRSVSVRGLRNCPGISKTTLLTG